MTNYATDNALLQICRRVNRECQQVDRRDLEQLTAILQQNYQQVKSVLPDVSYSKFKYILAQINGRVIERD